MVEQNPGRKADARRPTLLAEIGEEDGAVPQDPAATNPPVGSRCVTRRQRDVGAGSKPSAATPLQPEGRVPREDLETSPARQRQGSLPWLPGDAAALTRRDFLMWNSALLGAIAGCADDGPPPPAPDLPFFGQYYGNVLRGNVGDSHLDGGGDFGVFAFFIAERTGTVTGLNWYYRYDFTAGTYSRGNGGTYTIEIRAANPSTKLPLTGVSPICSMSWSPHVTTGAGQQFISGLNFTTTGQLIAKQAYALIARNTASSPSQNYVSQNTCHFYAFFDDTDPANYEEPGDGVSGAIAPEDVSTTIKPVTGWHPVRIDGTLNLYPLPALWRGHFRYRRFGQPFLAELIYSDGQRMNWGSWASENTYARAVQGTNQVRERFRVSRASRVVSGVFIRVSKHNASGGSCVVTLESGPASNTSGNGSVIEQISVPAANFKECGNHFSIERWVEGLHDPTNKVHWVWVPFSTNRTLTLGNIYSLRLSASGGFDGKVWVTNRSPFTPNLDDFDDHEANRTLPMNAWEDSLGAQISTNGGSTWVFTGSRQMAPLLFKCV
jgi:hypothetical protein